MRQVNLPEKVYFKEGCTPVALRELAEIYHRKRVLLVSGLAALRNDTVMKLSRFFEKQDIQTAEVIVSDAFPTYGDLQEPLHKVQEFLPDVILGVGSDGVLSAAKGLRFLYENPEMPLEQASFVSGLHAGEKALLVLMGTTLEGDCKFHTGNIFQRGASCCRIQLGFPAASCDHGRGIRSGPVCRRNSAGNRDHPCQMSGCIPGRRTFGVYGQFSCGSYRYGAAVERCGTGRGASW